jgi:hypothetical protein
LDNGSRKIELIAPQEIQAAVEQVVRTSFGITDEEIPLEVCRMLGFVQTSANMGNHIEGVIDHMVEDNVANCVG